MGPDTYPEAGRFIIMIGPLSESVHIPVPHPRSASCFMSSFSTNAIHHPREYFVPIP